MLFALLLEMTKLSFREGVEAACPAREEKEALWVAVMPVWEDNWRCLSLVSLPRSGTLEGPKACQLPSHSCGTCTEQRGEIDTNYLKEEKQHHYHSWRPVFERRNPAPPTKTPTQASLNRKPWQATDRTPPKVRKLHNKENSTNYQNIKRPPQTQQYNQDEETEHY